VVYFDGLCNLCSSSVQFILKRDSHNHFYFASLQSEQGRAALKKSGLDENKLNSVVLFQDSEWYTESSAALHIVRRLTFPWPLLYAFIAVPKFIRDAVYRFISRNRYKWFGQKQTCWLPRPEWQNRFIDQPSSPAV